MPYRYSPIANTGSDISSACARTTTTAGSWSATAEIAFVSRISATSPGRCLRRRRRSLESHPKLLREEANVIKLDIINEVVNRTGITKTKAEMAVETVFESMKRSLSKGDRIELRGFGVFNVRPRKTGIGRNPRTGAEVSIPPGKAVRFKPGKELQTIE